MKICDSCGKEYNGLCLQDDCPDEEIRPDSQVMDNQIDYTEGEFTQSYYDYLSRNEEAIIHRTRFD
jgi:hypothetical protein